MPGPPFDLFHRYRRKFEVEAFQWTGDPTGNSMVIHMIQTQTAKVLPSGGLWIRDLSDEEFIANVGDWVIRDVIFHVTLEERYSVCPNDVFGSIYDLIPPGQV